MITTVINAMRQMQAESPQKKILHMPNAIQSELQLD